MRRVLIGITGAALATVLTAGLASAAATPEQKCQGAKNQAAGKYAACRQKAEKGLATSGDATKYGESITKCETKFATAWQKAIDAATAAAVTCPDAPLAEAAYKAQIDGLCDNVATALNGGGLANCSGDLATCTADLVISNGSLATCTGSLGTCNSSLGTCNTDLGTCNSNYSSCSGSLATVNAGTAVVADVLAGKTFSSSAGVGVTGTATAGSNVTGAAGSLSMTIPDAFYSGSKTATANDADLLAGNVKRGVNLFGTTGTLGLPKTGQTTSYGAGSDGVVQAGTALSYTDNGDGTITDNTTGLMWEKKDDSAGIHGRNNLYTWGMTSAPYTMNGTMVTTFLAALNAGGGFAGHTDWRIPNITELSSILNREVFNPSVSAAFHNAAGCTGCSDVTVASCSCARSNYYWSSTTFQDFPSFAWVVDFDVGYVIDVGKSNTYAVRAVRGGL